MKSSSKKFSLCDLAIDFGTNLAAILIITILLPILIIIAIIYAPFACIGMYLSDKRTAENFKQRNPDAAARFNRSAHHALMALPISPLLAIPCTLITWFMYGPFSLFLGICDIFHKISLSRSPS